MTSKVISSSVLPADLPSLLGDVTLEMPLDGQWQRDEVMERIASADALISLLSLRVDDELLQAAPKLKVIANYAVGFDNIDLAAATRRGIVVTNTPDVLTHATADLAFALMLGTARRLGEATDLVGTGQWQGWAPQLMLGCELHGKTVGVIGAGRIGCAFLQRAQGFSMQLRYCGPRPSASAEALGAQRLQMQDLLSQCDFISLHCPLVEDNRECIDAQALSLMKKNAVLVNTARGGLVDYQALADSLNKEEIFGAGIDVFVDEPQVPQALLDCPRALLTPHIGSATLSARQKMAQLCAAAVRTVLSGECPPNALNPEVMA